MKRILFALAALSLAVGTSIATTRAVWTDTVTVTNNQVQTGTADLQVSKTYGGGSWNTSTVTSSMVISDLIPGGEGDNYSFTLWNNSTVGVDFDLTGQITAVTGAGSDESQLELAVYEESATPGDTFTESSDWISLSDWQSLTRDFNSTITPGIGNIKNYRIAAKLLPSATNDWQGRTVTMTFTVTGTQP